MPIVISAQLIGKLPEDERADIKEFLWKKSGQICSLCDGPLNLASDIIEPDHVIPEAEGGKTERANLKLAHKGCNAFKRNAPSIDVRPFLRLRRFLQDRPEPLAHYGDCLPFFAITPRPCRLEAKSKTVVVSFPDGSSAAAPILIERNRSREYRFAFVQVPKPAIFNDEDVQPRTIKLEHLWKLYSDIQRNPLHEPPSLRVGRRDKEGLSPLLMFDGQHKSIAVWLSDRDTVVAKIYLDLDTVEAVKLVNSIQARIPKLPLSVFELAAKMDDENKARLQSYLTAAGAPASEKGFIQSAEPGLRDRVRTAFGLALAHAVIENPDLLFAENVARSGERVEGRIFETVFKRKVVDPLLHRAALEEPWADAEELRARELDNIIGVLNRLHERVFVEPPGGYSAQERERRRRMSYQSSLSSIARLLKKTFAYIVATDEDRAFLEKDLTPAQWALVDQALDRLVDHPIWTVVMSKTGKTIAVETALSKNQEADSAFRGVGLTTGYLVGADPLAPDWDT